MPTRRNNPAVSADQGDGEMSADGEWRAVVPTARAGGAVVEGEDVETDPGERIAMLIRDSGSDSEASVRVYKRIPNSVKYSWCVNYTAGEFQGGDLGMIRDQWGPGEYSLRVYGRGGLLAREDVTIAQQVSAAPTVVASAQSQSDQFMRAIEAIAQGQAALMQALSTRPDPTQQMQQTLTLMAQMREAMGLNQNPAPAPAMSPTAVLKEVIEAVRSMKEISEEINPKAADFENPLSLAGPLLEVIKTAVAQRSGSNETVAPLSLPPSLQCAPESNPVPAPVQTRQTENEQMGIMLLRGALQGLLQLKEQGEPATAGGRYIAEKIPDELLPYLDLPNWFDIARNFAPELAPHEAWVRDATAEAIRILSENPADPGA